KLKDKPHMLQVTESKTIKYAEMIDSKYTFLKIIAVSTREDAGRTHSSNQRLKSFQPFLLYVEEIHELVRLVNFVRMFAEI
ncbi:hypothetical protein ACJX0J_005921, partial [Zea mays]